jgi:hypothetical protein
MDFKNSKERRIILRDNQCRKDFAGKGDIDT